MSVAPSCVVLFCAVSGIAKGGPDDKSMSGTCVVFFCAVSGIAKGAPNVKSVSNTMVHVSLMPMYAGLGKLLQYLWRLLGEPSSGATDCFLLCVNTKGP